MSDFDISQPFTRAAALTAGIAPGDLRTQRFVRVFRGVYVSSETSRPWIREAAAVMLQNGPAFLSHHSAALVHGVPVPHVPDVHVTVLEAPHRCHRLGIQPHVTTEEVPAVVQVDGLPISHPHRTFLELAGVLPLVELVVVGDAMARILGLEPEALRDACMQFAREGRHHAWSAGRAAHYVRAGVDSPMESRLRMLLVLAGLPEPEVNYPFRSNGRVRRRSELAYPGVKLLIEYDGREHVERIERWENDLRRREEFDRDDWQMVVVTASGVFRTPEQTVTRVRERLIARGWRPRPVLSDEWRLHFPGY